MRTPLRTVAVVGTGSIGSSWATLALTHGLVVHATDPAPGAQTRLRAVVSELLAELDAPAEAIDRLRFELDPAAAVESADLVLEAGPERVDAEAGAVRRPRCRHPTGGPARQQLVRLRTERLPGRVPASRARRRDPSVQPPAPGAARRGRRRAPHLRGGGRGRDGGDAVVGAPADPGPGRAARPRRQPAAGRALARGLRPGPPRVPSPWPTSTPRSPPVPGLRWALLGPIATQHLSGGPGGLAHVLEHLGPPMVDWWADLGAPELTPELVDTLVDRRPRGARRS